ncbi:MAG: peptide-binding protein [Pirellulaceae bacterium]|nr:MAG: peptide-binding protein [Pirellulaceae bacterium]
MQVKLKVLSGKSSGKELVVPYQEFLIGRSEACHLRPKSDAVSRKHCRLLLQEDGVYVEDLGSRNGTFINGERVTQRRLLRSGDVLRIAKLEFAVLVDQEIPAAQPAPGAAQVDEVKEETWADEEITRWLEESAPAESDSNRHLRLDPEERSLVDTALNRSPTEATVVVAAPKDAVETKPEDTQATADDKEKKEAKKPGKLPPRPIVQAASSGEAAAQMLKKFFTRP